MDAKAMDRLKKDADVIILISDDEDDMMCPSVDHGVEKMMVVKDESVRPEQKVEESEPAVDARSQGNVFCSNNLKDFIRKYNCDDVKAAYHADVIQAVSHTPYCLYLYVGVEVDEGQRTSLVLIGYFDQFSGVGVVRLLHALRMSFDEADPQISVNANTENVTLAAESDARLLIEELNKYELPLSNLVMFYCSVPGVSHVFVSQLQVFNPKLISLCSLPGMAGRACQAGLVASFSYVVDLIREIHHHYSTCSSMNDCLKELFSDAHTYDPSQPVSAHCLFIIHTVQKMVGCWQDLVGYFKSLTQTEDTNRIRTKLLDDKVRLHFLFLSHSLEPLKALHESGTADVAAALQLASLLVHSYSVSILQPSLAERFSRRRNVHLLHSEMELLPTAEVNIGPRARYFMLSSILALTEEDKSCFLKDAQTFYKAALQSLVESLPRHLRGMSLRNIRLMLRDPENLRDKKRSDHVLSDLGVQLGLCTAGSPQTRQLLCDYLSFVQTVRVKQSWKGERRCWAEILQRMRPYTTLHRLFLTILALPSSLNRSQLFAEVFKSRRDSGRHSMSKRKHPAQAGYGGRKREEESSSEDAYSFRAKPAGHYINMEDSDYTDNSSDVVDITEEIKISQANRWQTENRTKQGESIFIVTSEDDEDSLDSALTPPSSRFVEEPMRRFCQGELVWGKIQGFSPWPGIIVPYRKEREIPEKRMVEWYGQRMSSQISVQALTPFAAFGQKFCANSFATLVTYREAIFLSLQEAALRCEKEFPLSLEEREELLPHMIDWAFGGFLPTGPDGLKPRAFVNGVTRTNTRPKVKQKRFQKTSSSFDVSSHLTQKGKISIKIREVSVTLNKLSCDSFHKSSQSSDVGGKGLEFVEQSPKTLISDERNGKREWEGERDESGGEWEKVKRGWGRKKEKESLTGGRNQKKTYSDGVDDDMSPDFVPYKRKTYSRPNSKANQTTSVYTQPDQKLREETIRRIMDMNLDIEGFCLCCGTEDVVIFHPLFKGSLCLMCKHNFTETLYRYDEDGYQSYCTICCYGMEVMLCGNDSCCRSYCQDCLNILAGPGTFDSLKKLDPWICYLCQHHQPHGAIVPREDWSIRVQEFFANNSGMEFETHRVYPSIPANLRRPIRVLSLFDGIATGYLVLKDLGFKVEKYVASEVCEDSVAAGTVNHEGRIINVGDVRVITEELIEKWGPFDLLIGGSPCNDLSIVNPNRKGLYEGTGRLFFDYYRILQLLKPKEDDPRPFFWLYENVVFMNIHDRVNICRFLECNPVLVDAVKVSPAHRARYFWGNIPGMSRPIIASKKDKLNLQDCLEIGREARVTKVRTVTTNSNSLKQGKGFSLLPVLQNGREDSLWITELEKIFGFPKHYTDVRNMSRQQRQKALGKSWSVPVIRHLFAPLKDYFACEELPPVTTTCTSPTSSTSSTSPSSPASPDPQPLR
ncbi:DNA (cytosine-5)-methyltransferase 3B-like isoform X2 [Melanotaenia boesemani]|uniref:DNA (cytosine-5)-methyltransferase 3B-like isoform X2 n=1 Tax=Melanotaenia boesemani TaxID=1250792 RepID=UPI001C04AA9B|nr:DNA (cytosine-5)-methyltransferase 3B-like isoform X2 [Melanotaenia boesemani]